MVVKMIIVGDGDHRVRVLAEKLGDGRFRSVEVQGWVQKGWASTVGCGDLEEEAGEFCIWEENTPDEIMVYGVWVPAGFRVGVGRGEYLGVQPDPEGEWEEWKYDISHRLPKTRNDGSGEVVGEMPAWAE